MRQQQVMIQEHEAVKLFGAEIPVSALETFSFWAFCVFTAVVILLVVYLKYVKGGKS